MESSDKEANKEEQTVSSPPGSHFFPHVFLAMLAGWGLVNLLQSIFTPISEDEAYYWMYSRFLDWGYFDHPPMIALFIKTGNLLFSNELGTRVVTLLTQLLVLAILWILIREKYPTAKRVLFFFGISASVVMFQVYGFIATPDSPLLLFTALFLLSYHRFLEKESLPNCLLLAVSMAGLVYSKYHGVLVIFFVMLSNPALWFRWKFWLAALFSVLLFMPHILWQIHHDFPTFQYHLVSRSRPPAMKNIIAFWPNQLVTFNPVFLGLSFFILFRFKPGDRFERALYFLIGGFLLFFFLSTYRGHVEPHWTIASCLAMIILVYRRSMDHASIRKFVSRVLFPTILLLVVARLTLIFNFIPVHLKFHGNKEWCSRLASVAGERPVIFSNTYQKPSLYTFYTGKPSTSLNGISYKKSQYDLWNFDQSFFGKKALLVSNQNTPTSIPLVYADGKKAYLYPTDHFFSVQKIEMKYDLPADLVFRPGDTLALRAVLYNPYPYAVEFQQSEFPVSFLAVFFESGKKRNLAPVFVSREIIQMQPGEKLNADLEFSVPDIPPAVYNFGIVLQAGFIEGAFNSRFVPVQVQPRNQEQ